MSFHVWHLHETSFYFQDSAARQCFPSLRSTTVEHWPASVTSWDPRSWSVTPSEASVLASPTSSEGLVAPVAPGTMASPTADRATAHPLLSATITVRNI